MTQSTDVSRAWAIAIAVFDDGRELLFPIGAICLGDVPHDSGEFRLRDPAPLSRRVPSFADPEHPVARAYVSVRATHRTMPTICASAGHGRVGHACLFRLSLCSSHPAVEF